MATTLDELTIQGVAEAPLPVPQELHALVPEPGKIAITDADGSVNLIAREDADQAINVEGAHPSTDAEYFRAKMGSGLAASAAALGASRGLTFGLSDAAAVGVSRFLGGEKEAEDTRRGLNVARDAYPTLSTAGEIGGSLLGLAFTGGGAGAAKAVTASSALGRAAQRAVAAAPRALEEGAALGLGEQLTEDTLGNHELVAQKYLAAGVKGGLLAVLLGGGLAAGGGAIGDKLAGRAARAVEVGEATGGRVTIDPDAGLSGLKRELSQAEDVFHIGAEQRPVFIRPGGRAGAAAVDEPIAITRSLGIDPDAGLHAPARTAKEPIYSSDVRLTDLFKGDGTRKVNLAGDLYKAGKAEVGPRPVRASYEVRTEPDAGLYGGPSDVLGLGMREAGGITAKDGAFRLSSAKTVPRSVDFIPGSLSELATENPIRISAPEQATAAKGLSGWLASTAEGQAFKATGAQLKDWQKLGRTAEEQEARARRIGRLLLDEGMVSGGASHREIAERLTARLQKAGEELETLRSGLNKAAVRPSVDNVVDRIQREVLAPLRSVPFTRTEEAAVQGALADILDKTGERATFKSFDQLHKFRRALDEKLDQKLWQKIPGSAPPGAVELGKVRGILESEYERAAEEAAKELGGTIVDKYRFAKAVYSDLARAEEIATKTTARGGANRAVSLTDTIAGSAGMATAGPMGLLAAGANKLMRGYGNQVAASALDRASRLQMFRKAAEASDTKVKSAVLAFFDAGPAPKAPPKLGREEAASTVRALREAARDPDALTARVTETLEADGIGKAAPKVAQSIAMNIARAAAAAGARLPREPAPMGVAWGPQRPRPMGPETMAKSARVIEALDFDSVLAALGNKRLNRAHVEMLQLVRPDIFAEIQKEVREYGIAHRPELTQQQEAAMRIIFNEPVSFAYQPKTVAGLQSAFAQNEQGQSSPPKRPLGTKRASSIAPATDRSEALQ